MNVVYFSSDFFSEICGVSIESLCENNIDVEDITVFIVENNISESNKEKLKNVGAKYNRNIVFIQMPKQEDVFPGVKMNLGNAYARMAIGEILPRNIDRVLMLDCDTLILDSIKKLYDIPFKEDEYVAGVYDCVGEAYQNKVLGAPKDIQYCNAGVFLVELNKWRNLDVKSQLIKVFREKKKCKLFFLEQDIMNIVFYKHIKVVGLRYNIITSLDLFEYEEVMYMKHPTAFYSREEFYEARKNPAIIHGATCFYVQKRMWVPNSDHPRSIQYRAYREKTNWNKVQMIQDQRTVAKKLYAHFWHVMPRKNAIKIVAFLMIYIRPLYARLAANLKIDTVAKRSAT